MSYFPCQLKVSGVMQRDSHGAKWCTKVGWDPRQENSPEAPPTNVSHRYIINNLTPVKIMHEIQTFFLLFPSFTLVELLNINNICI